MRVSCFLIVVAALAVVECRRHDHDRYYRQTKQLREEVKPRHQPTIRDYEEYEEEPAEPKKLRHDKPIRSPLVPRYPKPVTVPVNPPSVQVKSSVPVESPVKPPTPVKPSVPVNPPPTPVKPPVLIPLTVEPSVPVKPPTPVKSSVPVFLSVHQSPLETEKEKVKPATKSVPTSYYYEEPTRPDKLQTLYDYYDDATLPRSHRKQNHRKSYRKFDGVMCTDSNGNKKLNEPGRPDMYKVVVGPTGTRPDYKTVIKHCEPGTFFDIKSCECEGMPEEFLDSRQCLIYLPFNDNLTDCSIQRFSTYVEGPGKVVVERNSFATGTGCARFDKKTRLEIPGRLKTTTHMQVSATWCTFFRCETNEGSYNCEENYGLISNNRVYNNRRSNPNVESTFSLNIQQTNTVVAKLYYERPGDAVVLEGRFTLNKNDTGFVHVCVTHDPLVDKLYINKNVVDTKRSHGKLMPVSGPYTIGYTKPQYYFKGLIDDVLICDHTMHEHDIVAHYEGNRAVLSQKGFIPQY